MSTFSVQPERAADGSHAWLLTVTGDFDASSTDAFDDALEAAVEHGARLVTLDLSDVAFLDSSGLRSVVHASNRLADRGGQLVVAGLSGAAQRVLELSGLIERLTRQAPDAE